MKYAIENNATALINTTISGVDTSIVLAAVNTNMSALLGQVTGDDWTGIRCFLTITDSSESVHEIVLVTAWDSATSTVTVLRGQDGTGAASWGAGSIIESRWCKAMFSRMLESNAEQSLRITDNLGAPGDLDEFPAPYKSISIGKYAYIAETGNYDEGAIAIGSISMTGKDNVHISAGSGSSASCELNYSVLVGNHSEAYLFGDLSTAWGGVFIGHSASGLNGCTIVGNSAWSSHINNCAIGTSAHVSKPSYAPDVQPMYCIAFGYDSEIGGAVFSVAMGHKSRSFLSHASHLAFLPCNPKTSSIPESLEAGDIATRHRAAPMMTLGTGIIDLTNATSEYEIKIPTGTHFFPDRIDVVITSATTPSGTPEIAVGTTTGGTDILAATGVTKTVAHQRQSIVPTSLGGVTSIFVSTATAGAGTLTCRVFVVGYFVVDE